MIMHKSCDSERPGLGIYERILRSVVIAGAGRANMRAGLVITRVGRGVIAMAGRVIGMAGRVIASVTKQSPAGDVRTLWDVASLRSH